MASSVWKIMEHQLGLSHVKFANENLGEASRRCCSTAGLAISAGKHV